ncbi:MAG TPA: Fic family protein [Spongiibacteraceae bacterium]
MTYNWQRQDWPNFRYDLGGLHETLFAFAEKVGHASGTLKGVSDSSRSETILNLMIEEAVNTSAIEGEYLNRSDVKSSMLNHMGLNKPQAAVHDKRARGIGELMLDVRNNFAGALSESTLFSWHRMLMQGNSNRHLIIGDWRKGEDAMQVVSGPIGKHKIHFEAPPSVRVPQEMKRFIDWFNATAPGGSAEIKLAPVRSAIAHLYFESIHPFDDGNGRIGRAISAKALSQGLGRPVLLSLSKAIEAKKNLYYNALEKTQKSNEITAWVKYFIETVLAAQIDAEALINFILAKAQFFDRYEQQMSDRQLKAIRRMLENGPQAFEGGMNARKYSAITGASKATATRDLQALSEMGVLVPIGEGRSRRYEINISSAT